MNNGDRKIKTIKYWWQQKYISYFKGVNYHDRLHNYCPGDVIITYHITVVVICPYVMDDLHLSA